MQSSAKPQCQFVEVPAFVIMRGTLELRRICTRKFGGEELTGLEGDGGPEGAEQKDSADDCVQYSSMYTVF
jgi:hypothetical protein